MLLMMMMMMMMMMIQLLHRIKILNFETIFFLFRHVNRYEIDETIYEELFKVIVKRTGLSHFT
jgi:hypothetical protein